MVIFYTTQRGMLHLHKRWCETTFFVLAAENTVQIAACKLEEVHPHVGPGKGPEEESVASCLQGCIPPSGLWDVEWDRRQQMMGGDDRARSTGMRAFGRLS